MAGGPDGTVTRGPKERGGGPDGSMTRGPKERGRGAGSGARPAAQTQHLLSVLSKDREAQAEVQVLTAVSLPPSHNCLCFNFLTCEQWGEDLPSKLL